VGAEVVTGAFNSLFEMRTRRVSTWPRAETPFNSLFEMQKRRKNGGRLRRRSELSILYLRCKKLLALEKTSVLRGFQFSI